MNDFISIRAKKITTPMNVEKYQENYSLLHGERILNETKRFRKAKQVLLITQ